MHLPQFPDSLLAIAAGLALASVVVVGIGLFAVRFTRRSATLRHGLLFCTLCVLLLLPATPFAALGIDADWLPRVPLVSRSEKTGATGSASATSARSNDDFGTLSADEIPAGAILPGRPLNRQPGATGSASASARSTTAAGGLFRSTPATRSSHIDYAVVAQAAIAVWLFGAFVSLARTLRAGTSVARLVHRAAPVTDESAVTLLHELSRTLCLRRPPRLRGSKTLRVPFAWGFVRPVVVLPQALIAAGDVHRLRPILLHELAHVKRRDVWIGLLQRFAGAAYWWNPLVYMLNVRLAEAREQICDAHVLAGGCPSREYAEILVDLAAQITLRQPVAALGLLSRSEPQLTRRVQHLLEDQPMSTALRSFTRIALMGLFIVLTTTAVLMAYVLVDDGYLRQMRFAPTSQPQHYTVATTQQNWTPPQPAASPSVLPAVQGFVAPEQSGVEGRTATLMFGADADFAKHDADPFAPAGGTAAVSSFGGDEAGADSPFGGSGVRNPAVGAGAVVGVPGATEMMRASDYGGAATGVQFTTDGTLRGLAVVELVGNDDGTLKELRWFTESLGTGEEAYAKLTERLIEFGKPRVGPAYRLESVETSGVGAYRLVPLGGWDSSGQMTEVRMTPRVYPSIGAAHVGTVQGTPAGPGMQLSTQLSTQITASPQLRYEHVARVVELCELHVQRVFVTQANLSPQVTLTLGFVRDGSGKQISSSPVLIWNDAVLPAPVDMTPVPDPAPFAGGAGAVPDVATPMQPPHDEIVDLTGLTPRLLTWRQMQSPEKLPKTLAVLIRADAGVDPKLVEQVVQVTLPAGFERVILQPLESPSAAPTEEPAATQEPITPQVEPMPSQTSTDNVPNTILPKPTLLVTVPAMGPVPIALNFDFPIVGATSYGE